MAISRARCGAGNPACRRLLAGDPGSARTDAPFSTNTLRRSFAPIAGWKAGGRQDCLPHRTASDKLQGGRGRSHPLPHGRGSDWAARQSRRGSALLMVLWISAALAAVSFSLANTVRGETDRTSTVIDDVRGYYLATGAIDRAAVELLWSVTYQGERKIKQGSAWVDYNFPSGAAHVELIPETAKMNVNLVPPERLMRLMAALGIDPAASLQIVQGILAHRPGAPLSISQATAPTFPQSATSFQEIEELLSVRGVTPEIFYGTYVPAQGEPRKGEPRLVRRSGLVDCLTVYGTGEQVDANTADPAVLAAVGMPPATIAQLVQARKLLPLNPERLAQFASGFGPAAAFIRLEGNSILTIRATARARLASGQLSDMKRTVSALVKYMPSGYSTPIHILRWYDTTWSN